jgi:hypothetical protein
MTVGDIDNNGSQDMVVQMDGFKSPIVGYSATGPDTYTRTAVFDSSTYHSDYNGSAGKLAIADFDADGNKEVYLPARGGGMVWVVNNITDAATAFQSANFNLISDIPNDVEGFPADGLELRGGVIGDADNNGLPDLYITARDPFEAVYDFEWIGGVGGDVTDPDNYQIFKLYNDDNADGVTVGMVAVAVADLDGDGVDHQDIVFTTGNGNEGVKPGIFVIEFDAAASVPPRANNNFDLAWDAGLGAAGTDPPNMVRGWGVAGGFDLDKDGKREITSYDATLRRIHVWESNGNGDNEYNLVWFKDKNDPVTGEGTLVGGERSIMITDLDEDGNRELVNVWDAFHPDSTNGFAALEVYEHDPTSGAFLPDEPTVSFDPPRDAANTIRLEYQSQYLDVDADGDKEMILTYRGRGNLVLSIISLPNRDFANPQWQVEYTDGLGDIGDEGARIHSMTVGDIDNNGSQDMVVQMDGFKSAIVVYSATGADTYTRTAVFDSSAYHSDYNGSAGKLAIADFDEDGNKEVYLPARGGGKVWVVNNITDAATAFQSTNFNLISDIPNDVEGFPADGLELRGGIIGDADWDGLLDLYITARDPFEAVYDFEWIGGVGGDVTDPDNYQITKLYNDDNADGVTVGMVSVAVADIDGDGFEHQDVVFTTGNGNEGVKPGIFVIEYDISIATGVASPLPTFVPESFALQQNYPNPFNPTTTIRYDLRQAGDVKLRVFNVLGQEVRTLVNRFKGIGRHEEFWDGKDNAGNRGASGVYVYALEIADKFKESKKMLLLK